MDGLVHVIGTKTTSW